MKLALFAAAVLAAACGSKPAPAPAGPAPTGGAGGSAEGGERHGMEHEAMAPELSKFHDVLAPRWHAEKGAKRMSDTCGAIGEFQADADAIAKAAPPATGDAAKWSAGATELTASVNSLDAACKASDAGAFEPAFARVHTAFHAMLEAGAGPEHQDMHEHEGMGSAAH